MINDKCNLASRESQRPERSDIWQPAPLVLATALLLSLLAKNISAQEPAGSSTTDRVVLIDGSTIAANVEGIDTAGQVKLAGQDSPLPLTGLRRIERAQIASPATNNDADHPLIVELVDGGRLIALSAVLDDEACVIRWAYGEKLPLPIDAIHALRLQPQKAEPDFETALAGAAEETDRIFLRVEEKLEVVRGLIEKLDNKEVVFEFQGKETTLPRDRVFGVILATVSDAKPQPGDCLLTLAGGTSVWGESFGLLRLWVQVRELAGGSLKLKAAGQEITVPWTAVKSLTVRSDRLTFLSDLKPADVEQQSIVAPARPWQADRSIAGRTLTLRKQTFEKGLGVASYSRLEYELTGDQDLLAAVIGIDDETTGQGECDFVVRGDGRELFRLHATGREASHALRLDVRGVRKLELIVEPGTGLDLADHADWADACLIRTSEK